MTNLLLAAAAVAVPQYAWADAERALPIARANAKARAAILATESALKAVTVPAIKLQEWARFYEVERDTVIGVLWRSASRPRKIPSVSGYIGNPQLVTPGAYVVAKGRLPIPPSPTVAYAGEGCGVTIVRFDRRTKRITEAGCLQTR